MGSKERLESNNMAVTLNEVIRMQEMMIDAGGKVDSFHNWESRPFSIIQQIHYAQNYG